MKRKIAWYLKVTAMCSLVLAYGITNGVWA